MAPRGSFVVAAGADAPDAGERRRCFRVRSESGMIACAVVDERDARRSVVEAFVRQSYLDRYGGAPPFLPNRMTVHFDADGRVVCAAGLRSEDDGFFSEAYLDSSIETALGAVVDGAIERRRIVEVTSFASREPRATARFIAQIATDAREAGFLWSFFTVTRRLGALLERHGAPLVRLAAADPSRIERPSRWGSYYEHAPTVYASPLTENHAATRLSREAA